MIKPPYRNEPSAQKTARKHRKTGRKHRKQVRVLVENIYFNMTYRETRLHMVVTWCDPPRLYSRCGYQPSHSTHRTVYRGTWYEKESTFVRKTRRFSDVFLYRFVSICFPQNHDTCSRSNASGNIIQDTPYVRNVRTNTGDSEGLFIYIHYLT